MNYQKVKLDRVLYTYKMSSDHRLIEFVSDCDRF